MIDTRDTQTDMTLLPEWWLVTQSIRPNDDGPPEVTRAGVAIKCPKSKNIKPIGSSTITMSVRR